LVLGGFFFRCLWSPQVMWFPSSSVLVFFSSFVGLLFFFVSSYFALGFFSLFVLDSP